MIIPAVKKDLYLISLADSDAVSLARQHHARQRPPFASQTRDKIADRMVRAVCLPILYNLLMRDTIGGSDTSVA